MSILYSRIFLFMSILLTSCKTANVLEGSTNSSFNYAQEVVNTLSKNVLIEANWAMQKLPITITAYPALKSAGGIHDFFSQADYFWPNPVSSDSPYIQKDGLSNPENFVLHRQAMIRLSKIIGALASAYKITGDPKYVIQAIKHCKAWFVDRETMMNPSLLYSQAIIGRFTGRGIGIIDSIQFLEVVQGLMVMENAANMNTDILASIKNWFSTYIEWLNTHPYGKAERETLNNHSTCWVMQVAAFAKFTDNTEMLKFCSDRYKNVLLPNQMSENGSFQRELVRTKPYGYSIFNLDAMATICQILSNPKDNLWLYTTKDGKSIQKGIKFLAPFLKEKDKWPYPSDVMYWNNWPVAQPALIFGAVAFQNKDWLNTWKKLEHQPSMEEVIRNLPVRHPIIWINE